MALVGYRSAKKGHDTISRKLINGAFIFVDLIHQDFGTPIHDLMDFLRVEFLRYGGLVGYIREKHCHQLPLTLDRAAGGKNLIGEVFGSVGSGFVVVDWWGFLGLCQGMATFVTKAILWWVFAITFRTDR
jgi:hypothetical protein